MGSLFEYISSSVVDGELPGDFSLQSLTEDESVLKWADGALDGVTVYHMSIPEISEDDSMLMTDAVRAASKGDFKLADDLFKMLGEHLQAIVIIDDLQAYIVENQSSLNARNLFEYALHLLFESDDRECVKFGLSLLELLNTDDHDDLKKAIRTIGLSDEFALFAIFVMLRWEDGNNEVWQLAKKVHGWGRIHAIERIEPDTEEIRKWLLLDGVYNEVVPAYSALTCWTKSNAEDVLRNDPSREEFTGIRDIIEGLLDEGPVPGISEISDRDEVISVFLDVAQTMELTLEDYEVIHEIYSYYAEEVSEKCDIALICKKILHTYHCRCLILDAVKQGKCIDLAIDTGVDVKPYILDLLKTSFENNEFLCRHVMQDPEFRRETLDLFRRELPLEEMKTQPTKTLGLGREYHKQSALEYLLQELRNYPYEGVEFVETGLQSAPIRTRNGAIYVLEYWVEEEKKPLAEIMPDMCALLTALRDIEPDDNVRDRMDRLIAGSISFKENDIEPEDE